MAQKPSGANHDFRKVDQLHKKGKKLAKGGMFSKKNPDDAEKAFEEARKELRKMRPATFESVSRLLAVLEDMSEAQTDMSLNNQAAKTMEEAARQATSNKKIDIKNQLLNKGPYYYEQASFYYLANLQYEKSCKMLQLAANLVIEIGENSEESIKKGIELYDQCCSIEENENRFKLCHEFFDAAIKFCVNNSKLVSANDFLKRQIKMYDNDKEAYYPRIFRNICSLMIIQFYLKDVKSAQRIYNEALVKYEECRNFCDQQKLCERLLKAFETADAETLEQIQKSGDLGLFLMMSVGRLGKKLSMQDIQPLTVSIDDLNGDGNGDNNNEQKENEQIKDEAKDDITEDQLASNVADTAVDASGAPDLLS